MGTAKNRDVLLLPPLLLLLFVPGSSRASFRSTAADDREDLTFPSCSLSLSSLFPSAALHAPCAAVHLATPTFISLPLKVNLKVFCAWPIFGPFLGAGITQL